jgi:hypothetical protein
LYLVSKEFLQAVQENTRNFYWTGKVTTKAGVEYPFTYDDIVKGSGYVTAQCCGSSEIEPGTVYAAEMGIYLYSKIGRYTLKRTVNCLTSSFLGWSPALRRAVGKDLILYPAVHGSRAFDTPLYSTFHRLTSGS